MVEARRLTTATSGIAYDPKKGGDKLFYHNDHLSGVNVVTDSLGPRVQLNEYDPWGGISRSEGSIDPDTRFTGQKLDPEPGLYYYGGRYYDQQISRFISPDPYVQAPDDPQNLNRYSYVLDNPQRYIDPTGYEYGDSSGSYSMGLYGWVKFFIDLFGSHHTHHGIPKPKYRGATTPPHAQIAKNRGQEEKKLKNVFVYDIQGSGGGENGGWQGGIRTVAAGGAGTKENILTD